MDDAARDLLGGVEKAIGHLVAQLDAVKGRLPLLDQHHAGIANLKSRIDGVESDLKNVRDDFKSVFGKIDSLAERITKAEMNVQSLSNEFSRCRDEKGLGRESKTDKAVVEKTVDAVELNRLRRSESLWHQRGWDVFLVIFKYAIPFFILILLALHRLGFLGPRGFHP